MNMKLKNLIIAFLLCLTPSLALTACDSKNSTSDETEFVDYVAQLKFNPNSGRKWENTTVHLYIDGDTTHFNVNWAENGVYKARYLGIDTPESTGAIQPWGYDAKEFTKSKLENATSIIIESDASQFEFDSTGTRYKTWVWYQPSKDADYRLLNLEIVQEGLSMLKNSSESIYGKYFTLAFQQAQKLKLKVAGNQTDPNFYYGGPQNTTIADLTLQPEKWQGLTVRVEGLITKADSTSFYFEKHDEVYEHTFGMQVFFGYNYTGTALIKEGNYISVCGKFMWSDIVSRWQMSDLHYYAMIPEHEENTYVIKENQEVVPSVIHASDLMGKSSYTVIDDSEDEPVVVNLELDNGYLNLNRKVALNNLTVESAYTTSNGGSNDGAITLDCKDENGDDIVIRTSVLYKTNPETNKLELVLQDEFVNKTINVTGIVDVYTNNDNETQYQVHVYFYNDIIIL